MECLKAQIEAATAASLLVCGIIIYGQLLQFYSTLFMIQGKAQGLLENFIQNKLSILLDSFIQFEKLMVGTSEGLTIHNTTIKPKLVEELSQILSMPLQHVSGSISSLTLNLPWQKLFLKADTPIKIQIEGVRLRCKLKVQRCEQYVMKKRQRMIADLTEKLFNPLNIAKSNISFINKAVKEYMLNRIVLEVRDICVQIEIGFDVKTELIFRIKNCMLKKEDKRLNESEKIHLSVSDLGLYYQTIGDKQVQLVSPANISYERIKQEGGESNHRTSTNNLNIDKIHIHLNNYNFGNIAKVLLLIKWHNSFVDLPFPVWKIKPHILSECKPANKFNYCARLILENIKESRLRKQLQLRRNYIALYIKLLTDTNNFTEQHRKQMEQAQKYMPIWKIIAYRSFAIKLTKFKIEKRTEEALKQENEKKVQNKENQNFNLMINMINGVWIKKWFSSQKDATQLQTQFLSRLASIQEAPNQVQTLMNAKIAQITVGISIISNFGVQPFISLVGFHCQWNKSILHMVNKWQQSLQFRKCKIQYQHYLGHNQRYKNLLSESKEHIQGSKIEQNEEEQDQFEEINHFMQLFFTNQSKVIELKLLPFDLVINYQVIEKINILLNVDYLSKVPNMKHIEEVYSYAFNPHKIIELQRQKILQNKKKTSKQERVEGYSPKPKNKNKQKDEAQQSGQHLDIRNIEFRLSSAANIIIPLNLRAFPETEVVIQIFQFKFRSDNSQNQILFKNILVNGHFLPQINQDQGIVYANYVREQIQNVTLIKKFDAKITIQKHINFDQNFIQFSPIALQLPSTENIFKLIQLIYLHIPKLKESKVRQYHRRKQSIGQQFMDACQNLNEHINKSIIMSSEKNTNRTIIKERKVKMTNYRFEGFRISDKSLELRIDEIQLKVDQMGFQSKTIQSYNNKKVEIIVKNLNKSAKILKDVSLHIKKQSIKQGNSKKPQEGQIKLNNIQIFNTDFKLILLLNQSKDKKDNSIELQFKNTRFYENQQARFRKIQLQFKLSYDQDVKSIKNQIVRVVKIPIIEECVLQHQANYKYNLFYRKVNINSLAINIKPSLFTLFSTIMKEFHVDQQAKYNLTNNTINTINIKIPPKNYYIELKNNNKCSLQKSFSEISLFNRKLILQFNQKLDNQIPKHKSQCIPISKSNFLINKQVAPNQFIIQSNIRIMNHQQKTLWIKFYQNQAIQFEQAKQNRSKLGRLSNYKSKPYSVSLQSQISMSQNEWNSYSNTKRSKIPLQSRQKGRCVTLPLKSKQLTHLLIDQDQHRFFQIIDQGKFFTELTLTDLFENKQKIIQSDQSSEQASQYLVIRSEVTQLQQSEIKVFTFHIYSPLILVNKTPWPLQYRISKDQSFQAPLVQQKKIERQRSFEVYPMKKIETLCYEKIRFFHYNEIQHMKISVNKYQREFFKFGNFVSKIKEKRKYKEGEIIQESQLMTLTNLRHQIQMVLYMQFSSNTMKIAIYPQFIFVNLAKKQLNFTTKEGDISYNQIRLNPLQKEYFREIHKNKNKLKQWEQQQKFLNEIINLESQKLKEREVLKQLFEKYKDYIETFTGSLSSQIRKEMIYKNGKQSVKKEGKFLKSTIGLLSDYASDSQLGQVKYKKSSSYLSEEQIIKYGGDKQLVFKRFIALDKSFNILLFIPTVHIINKSQAIFYAKSRSQNLVMIQKENHNFILANQYSIDIQACFDQHEEVSLTDWIEIKLQEFRTIYYAKDMIQYHGSGYQSKESYLLRKKKMKKMPKMFYRVITCKYERGQKIIIEESQYPPISFINNTKDRIKVSEGDQQFLQQLVNKGDMAEYAPRNPYKAPEFRIQIAQHYEYKQLAKFKVQKRQTLNLDFGIVLSIDEYKDNMIITIKSNTQQIESIQQNYLKQVLEQKQELLLQQVKKNTLSLKQMTIAVMNSCNKQLGAFFIQDFNVDHQNKNNKDYYKTFIKKIEGYDYMSVQPQYIFYSKKEKKILQIPLLKEKEKNNLIEFQIVIKEHKNALVVEKCQGILRDSVFCISADFILASVKNYEQNISNFYAFTKYYRSRKDQKKKSEIFHKKFIVQALKFESFFVTFKTINLGILETFINGIYEKLIVRFLNWLEDLKPISFETLELNHEQTTLMNIIKKIDLQKKKQEFKRSLMHYPVSELYQLFISISGHEMFPISHKLNTIHKLFKIGQYVVSWAIDKNENLKPQSKSYRQNFIQQHKENNNTKDKMKKFQYCEWKYATKYPRYKLERKIRRFQRYNNREQVWSYDQNRAKIKLAIDSFLRNKLFRPIDKIYPLNSQYLLAIVEEWVILYQKANEWTIIRVEYFLNCELRGQELTLNYWEGESELQSSGIFQNKGDRVRSKTIKEINLQDFNQETLQIFKEEIKDSILCCYY